MKRNKTKRKNNIFNFRVGSEEDLKDLRKRTKELKSKNTTPKKIYENGLLVEEGKYNDEATYLAKKQLYKATVNKALDELASNNSLIKLCNIRLKDLNPSRFKHLDEEEGVLKLFDENGNRII